ncbi:MAG TPA: glycine/sarcosine/betaine reductase selenoprotein B family protein [Acidobacteriota bacterium]|nr:glycine/sarcosine/betaine reductase selenoprotein B family protein [Acidobacteriota bacterium]
MNLPKTGTSKQGEAGAAEGTPTLTVITAPADADEIDRNLYLDYLSRKVMKGWMKHEVPPNDIPWTPPTKPLTQCMVALVGSAGIALKTDQPFDQEGERRNPWWGDPGYRLIPRGTRTEHVALYHMHIDTSFGETDLNCVLPMDRLEELALTKEIGAVAPTHYSFMGYLLKPEEFLQTSVPKIIERMRSDGADVALLVPA